MLMQKIPMPIQGYEMRKEGVGLVQGRRVLHGRNDCICPTIEICTVEVALGFARAAMGAAKVMPSERWTVPVCPARRVAHRLIVAHLR